MGWFAGAASSATAACIASQSAPAGKSLVLRGIHWEARGGGATAALVEIHTGNAVSETTLVIAGSTGGYGTMYNNAPNGFAKAKFISADATSNLATPNSVFIWGTYE